MHCPNCQQPIAAGIKFCGTCGFALQPAPRRSIPSAFGLMMVGVGIGLLSLVFGWAPTTAYYATSYDHYELKYSDGSTAQSEYLPSARNVGSGGGAAEAKVLSAVLLLAAGGGALWLRSRSWARWATRNRRPLRSGAGGAGPRNRGCAGPSGRPAHRLRTEPPSFPIRGCEGGFLHGRI